VKQLYERAIAAGVEAFKFEGHDVLVTYAKYLIEYLEDRFK